MTETMVAFDVETPNARNNRMSSIGITVIENGAISDHYYTLINPECRFDAFNIELTGITPKMAKTAPTFAEIWPVLDTYLSRGLLLAHNASFDMCVLGRCLNDYGIIWRSETDYACTVQMGKHCFPEFPNHKLNTMSELLGIQLDHHRADSDSDACAEIMLRCLDRGVPLDHFRRRYNLNECKTIPQRKGTRRNDRSCSCPDLG